MSVCSGWAARAVILANPNQMLSNASKVLNFLCLRYCHMLERTQGLRCKEQRYSNYNYFAIFFICFASSNNCEFFHLTGGCVSSLLMHTFNMYSSRRNESNEQGRVSGVCPNDETNTYENLHPLNSRNRRKCDPLLHLLYLSDYEGTCKSSARIQ